MQLLNLLRNKFKIFGIITGILSGLSIYFITQTYFGPWAWNIRNLYLGGPYLLVFISGIIYWKFSNIRKHIQIIGLISFITLEFLRPRLTSIFIDYFPNILRSAWALSLLMSVNLFIEKPQSNPMCKFLAYLGRQSFIIFLIHYPMLEFIKNL